MTAPLVARIEGYAARFHERDLNGDVIAPGAFAATLSQRRAPVRMLFNHDAAAPIGRWTSFAEDRRGLFVTGALLLASDRARDIHALLQGGALDGLSIGYRTVRARRSRAGERRILEADLWEVSIVTFPMAAGARISFTGSAEAAPDTDQQNSARACLSAQRTRARGRADQSSAAAASGRAPASPTGARLFAEAVRGAANILSL